MISIENKPLDLPINNEEFTLGSYRDLVKLALKSYTPVSYHSIPWGERFILWRHDCDFSLNRALILARIEAEEGLCSTFFILLHSEFYNVLERNQLKLVEEIVRLRHDIGLHFDANFYATRSEDELDEQVSREADLLEHFVGIRPAAFSFHTPSALHLTWEKERYGGLINCYSKRFKTEVPYCSDSNGYWRFRRLLDVLTEATDPCLQVLTHPEWWQDKPMPPRQRVFRCVYGRAEATMRSYDEWLNLRRRKNHRGMAEAILIFRDKHPQKYRLYDYLWNQGDFPTLFIELWCLHMQQIRQLCSAYLVENWKIAFGEVQTLLDELDMCTYGCLLLDLVFGVPWKRVTNSDMPFEELANVFYQIINGRPVSSSDSLEHQCTKLCKIIESLSEWATDQTWELPDEKVDTATRDRWDTLKKSLQKVRLV